MYCSYLTRKAEVRPAPGAGYGSFAVETIEAGETVAAFGGWVADRARFDELDAAAQGMSIQIDDELYLVAPFGTSGDRINHSCDPNGGMLGTNVIVARRDIAAGEEITFDYAMSDASSYDEFECACRSDRCRGKVTGRDWMDPDLQRRYRGYFSPYLARRISALASVGASRRAFGI